MSGRAEVRDQRRAVRSRGRRRRRGGSNRAPVPLQRAARAVQTTGAGGRRAWGAAWAGDRPMLATLLVVVGLAITMVAGPAQRYLDSSARLDMLEAKAEALEDENARLAQRKEDLTDEEHVELLAREQHGLVRPGEVAYTLVPPEVERPRIASGPQRAAETEPSAWYTRAWHTMQDWFQ